MRPHRTAATCGHFPDADTPNRPCGAPAPITRDWGPNDSTLDLCPPCFISVFAIKLREAANAK